VVEKKKVSMKQAILSKCHDCMGHYVDGKVDCLNQRCPLYNWMPYASLNPCRDWELYSPKKMGMQLKSDVQRTMTPEQRQACADRFAAARLKNSEATEEDAEESEDEEEEEE